MLVLGRDRTSTTVEKPLQIRPLMQNKPNFRKAKMNISAVNTKEYENNRLRGRGENKPNQTQFQRQKRVVILAGPVTILEK
jgi:hypothetical protein